VEASILTALSPLDGRYADKVAVLRKYLSEYALIRYRVLVEVRWLQHLADESAIDGLQPLAAPVKDVLNQLVDQFSGEAARRVKEHEKTTNHDMKAVEYFLREKLEGLAESSPGLSSHIHFACTSEDVNNLAYALMLRDALQRVLQPQMRTLVTDLRSKAIRYAGHAMLARTHGQPATPTTLGKELANFVFRLDQQIGALGSVDIRGKFNGAVGNFNAHTVAYPDADWPEICGRFVDSLGVARSEYTTQIEPHDWIAAYCHAFVRFNTVLIDLCRDLWSYVSLGYFTSRPVDSEVGSSTMPHKVNPIDFENAEGNLGIANALFEHLAAKLPISRLQRDLTDSTVLRNTGAAIGHTLVALDSCQRGLVKLDADPHAMANDLDERWEVLAEAVQTIMRRYGINDAYEQLKALTRGQTLSREALAEFITSADIPDAEKERLRQLTPGDYIGLATELARKV
jgi:adenylosuccinate lyase